MSIILNALKKSEAQRRLGKSPTLAETAAISSVAETRKRINLWWFALVLWLILATGWFARDLITKDPGDAQRAPVQGAAQSQPPPADQKSGTEFDDIAREARATFKETGEPAPVTRPVNRNTTALTTPVESYTAPPPEPAPVITNEDASQASGTEPENRPAVITAKAEPRGGVGTEPLTIYEIPRDIRASLPELKINLQVYDVNPENRFAVVNGQRYTQGAELASGLILSEIRQRGLVFTYRDYRFIIGN